MQMIHRWAYHYAKNDVMFFWGEYHDYERD